MVGRVGPGDTFGYIFVPRPEDLEICHGIFLKCLWSRGGLGTSGINCYSRICLFLDL